MPERTKTFKCFETIPYESPKAKNAVEVTLSLRDGVHGPAVSVCGAIWDVRHHDHVSGGQNLDQLNEYLSGDPTFARLYAIWQRWHLNDLKAGCEHQRALGWDTLKIDDSKPSNTYGKHCGEDGPTSWNLAGWVRPSSHERGKMAVACPECGYKYGTEWKTEPLPADVLAEINSLLGEAV